MIDSGPTNTSTIHDVPVAGNAVEQASIIGAQPSWPRRIWQALRRYPIPLGALALLLVSLVLWLVGRADLANGTLIVIVLMGGIPLL